MIGLSTYAFFWQHSERAENRLGLADMLRRTRELDVDLFQICDYAPLLEHSAAELRDLRALADDLGITIELGTKGVATAHLETFLRLAEVFDARLVRSMLFAPDHRPTIAEAEGLLRQALPAYEAAGVTLALETYEQVPTATLVSVVEGIGSDNLGICLDPANTVAILENPVDVIDRCAPHVKNVHVKDFQFTRRGGWVGFTLEGAQLGTGLLDYDHLMRVVDPEARGINRIIEHWIPWQDSFETTRDIEDAWNIANLTYLRSN